MLYSYSTLENEQFKAPNCHDDEYVNFWLQLHICSFINCALAHFKCARFILWHRQHLKSHRKIPASPVLFPHLFNTTVNRDLPVSFMYFLPFPLFPTVFHFPHTSASLRLGLSWVIGPSSTVAEQREVSSLRLSVFCSLLYQCQLPQIPS